MQTFQKVYQVVRKIPEGRVSTYGQIAKIVGTTPRVVGFALHANPFDYAQGKPEAVPCHRVVNRFGKLAPSFAFGGEFEQKMRLVSEGVEVTTNWQVDLAKFGSSMLDS